LIVEPESAPELPNCLSFSSILLTVEDVVLFAVCKAF
jgi:hypothetical protein